MGVRAGAGLEGEGEGGGVGAGRVWVEHFAEQMEGMAGGWGLRECPDESVVGEAAVEMGGGEELESMRKGSESSGEDV